MGTLLAAVWTWSLVRDVHASFGGIMIEDYGWISDSSSVVSVR